jgi:RecB family endonuclease NucS
MELGDGFAFVGERVRVQVGNQDFELDLLFYHRDLQCLVAFELKTVRFEPAHLGQLTFYLEALDRDRKRSHENPSIGVLLCRTKDDEVVEYAMSRHLSPALVAQYETRMIPKAVLQQKLHEWSLMLEAPVSAEEEEP